MDLELLKTFVEVNRTRHFGKAADNLFLTQAAVSARIRLLEDITGVRLFTRERNNIQLTDAGEKLLGYADTMITTWNRARHEIAAEDQNRIPLSVGAVASLWDMMLDDWVNALYVKIRALLLHAVVTDTTELLRRIRNGTLDLALMYESPQARGLDALEFAQIQLLMVGTEPDMSLEKAIGGNYVYVDWGTTFSIAHAQSFPDLQTPTLRVDAGRLARSFILNSGGSAYLAYQMVAEDLAAGRLHLVQDAPSIDRSAYAVYASRSEQPDVLQMAMKMLTRISKSQLL